MSSSGARRSRELQYAEIAADFSTASGVDVDTGLTSGLVTFPGGPVMCELAGSYENTLVAGVGILSLVDENNTLLQLVSKSCAVAATSDPIVMRKRLVYPAGAQHTLRLRMRVTSGTGTLYATAPDVWSLSLVAL